MISFVVSERSSKKDSFTSWRKIYFSQHEHFRLHTHIKARAHGNLIKMDLRTRLMSNKGPYGDFKLMQLLHKEIGLQRLCCTIKVLVLSQVMSIWLWLQGKRKSSRLNMRHDRSIHKVSNFNAYSGFSDDPAGSLWRNSNIQSTASKLDAENFPRTHQCFCFTCRHLFLRRILFLFFLPGKLRNFHVCTRSRSIILAQNELKLQVFLTLCSPRTDN